MKPSEQMLVSLLREDSRQSISTLAAKTSMSRKRVKDTIDRLTDTGIIKRFTIELEGVKETDGIKVFFHIRLKEPRCAALWADIKRFTEIISAWSVSSSELDMQILVSAANQARIEEIRGEIATHSLIQTMHSNLVLTTWRGAV
ncbi:Lrp/AsnC family transcriptional regulator [Ahrensia sp. 13_GOM-1096m]|uniref:Lrp/AsnC family transcriptional regulator n=1 Tax=Ahrensia sp. 13_GOM-1096m TaxID=1380380 RepID=UPI000553E5BE|nr:Lrp/AsnC family transcriptional regulator [Ahrensia sp. 13_GOM-1096m]